MVALKPMKTCNAEQARQAGDYSLATLRLFIKLRQRDPTPLNTLRHALFCRDLGYPLSPARARRLQRLATVKPWQLYLKGMKRRHVRQLHNLLAEFSNNNAMPAVAKPYQTLVANWRAKQAEWTQAFESAVSNAKRIAVVGNSPSIAGQHLGAEIDAHDLVIRFNHYQSEHTHTEDTGSKLSLWCMAPGVDKSAPPQALAVIIAGPNMLYQQQSFAQLKDYQGPVLSVPLHIWRQLVATLQAPPSAGVLLIAYLEHVLTATTMNNSPCSNRLSIYGFADIVGPNRPSAQLGEQYHHSLPQHRPVSRHNWARERQWLARF